MKTNNKFIQGYCCCLANIINSHGNNTHTEEAFLGIGPIDEAGLKALGVEKSDIDTFKKAKLL